MKFVTFMSSGPGRVIRVVAGLTLISVGATAGSKSGGWWWALAAFGLLPLGTGATGVCPITPLIERRIEQR